MAKSIVYMFVRMCTSASSLANLTQEGTCEVYVNVVCQIVNSKTEIGYDYSSLSVRVDSELKQLSEMSELSGDSRKQTMLAFTRNPHWNSKPAQLTFPTY